MAHNNGFLRFFLFSLLALLLQSTSFASSDSVSDVSIQWQISSSTPDGFSASLTLDREEGISQNPSSPLYNFSDDSDSDQLLFSTLISVPNGRDLSIEVDQSGSIEADSYIGEPFIFRGIRLFPVQFRPSTSYLATNTQNISELNFTTHFDNGNNSSPGSTETIRLSVEVYNFLKSHILNLDELDIDVVTPLGRILIVVEDDEELITELQPYIDWKTQLGYKVQLTHPDIDNYNQIKSNIESYYYDDDPIPLDYVLMIGDNDGSIRMLGHIGPSGRTDHKYTTFEDDLLGSLAIGRFSVTNIDQLRIAVKKTISYERDIDPEDTQWFNKSLLTVGSGSGLTPIQTSRAIRWMMHSRDMTAVDTLWFTMPEGDGAIPQRIVSRMNRGTSYVSYRGLYGMSGWETNIHTGQMLTNTKYPVVITLTCATGWWDHEETCISEGFVRAGSVNHPTGAVACIGTATIETHTLYNNIVGAGIFEAIFRNNVRTIGWSLLSSKYRLWEAYAQGGRLNQVENFSCWNNLMGDPALRMWVGTPSFPEVAHLDSIPVGQNYLDVNVTFGDDWPSTVWATISDENGVIDSKLIDQSVHTRLAIENMSQESFILTVAGDNVAPYQYEFNSFFTEKLIVPSNIVISDGVDGDGIANPGEVVTLDFRLTNVGTETFEPQDVTITSEDPFFTIISNSTLSIPEIEPQGTFDINGLFTISIDVNTPDNYQPEFFLNIDDTTRSAIHFDINSWELTTDNKIISTNPDSDSILLPGETGLLRFTVKNGGSVLGKDIQARIISISSDEVATMGGSISLGDISNESGANEVIFETTAIAGSNLYLGERVDFSVEFSDLRNVKDTLDYYMYVGDPRFNGLTGPCDYGYWAVDNDDRDYPCAPYYDWKDIILPDNDLDMLDAWENSDESTVIDLPFTFQYYGEEFNKLTVCTNGWVSMGEWAEFDFPRNWPIPNPLGSPAMIAPFWDDLKHIDYTDEFGTHVRYSVYAEHIESEGIFVVTWNSVLLIPSWENTYPINVQLILYDPEMYPTSTGNGVIQFQYGEIRRYGEIGLENSYETVGIESPDQRTGVQYNYWNRPDEGAQLVNNFTAVVFTDDLSASQHVGINDPVIQESLPTEFAIQNIYPNPFNPSTSIAISLPEAGDLTVQVFNLLGQSIATLSNGGQYAAGTHNFIFDVNKVTSHASGIYFVRASLNGNATQMKKIMLVR
jgi:Peptidase family C25/Secretion system C-terminal sorting domain